MGDKTAISWSDATWNCVTGCNRVSDGCTNCYAMTMAARLKAMGNPHYQRDGNPRTSGPGFGVTLHHDLLDLPRRWKRPRRVFVNSMSDLFHPDVPEGFIEAVWDVMADTPRHTYQILTKRPRRMRDVLLRMHDCDCFGGCSHGAPLPHVWLGVSVEDQRWADQRIPLLHEVPAAVRFLSCEPLLGPVELAQHLRCPACTDSAWTGRCSDGIGWVIVGGESGPNYRPMDLDWLRLVVERCGQEGVPVHVKQASGPRPGMRGDIPGHLWDMKAQGGGMR